MNNDALREVVSRLITSSNSLAALGAALQQRTIGRALDPILEPHVDAVVAALGVRAALAELTTNEARSLSGEIRTFILGNAKLVSSDPSAGWQHREAELLQAAGDASALLPQRLASAIAPQLDGLSARLNSAGSAFLDIGVGVAALSIEMARAWPSLRIVGIDLWAPALALAHEQVRAAKLDARIELRQQDARDLPDREAFDLVWVPAGFVPEPALDRLLERALRALRCGGWLLLAMFREPTEPLPAALIRLRAALFGGFTASPEALEQRLWAQGFVEVRTLPGPGNAPMALLAARRAPTARVGSAL
jgi:SAM-dependent methyltransferase